MRTVAYKVDVASDRRRRQNVPRHILCYPLGNDPHDGIRLNLMKLDFIRLDQTDDFLRGDLSKGFP